MATIETLRSGRTGVEMKEDAEARAKAEGIDLVAHSHVQGCWVHDAGPWTVFDWPERDGAHPRFRLQGGEWVSLEFATTTAVPEVHTETPAARPRFAARSWTPWPVESDIQNRPPLTRRTVRRSLTSARRGRCTATRTRRRRSTRQRGPTGGR